MDGSLRLTPDCNTTPARLSFTHYNPQERPNQRAADCAAQRLVPILVLIEYHGEHRNRPVPMKFAAFLFCLAGAALSGCSYLPTAGPTTGQVIDQAVAD